MTTEFFNQCEAWFWIGLAGAVSLLGVIRAYRPRRWWGLGAFALVAFGISDFLEMRTGAWWRPWWLLLWKAVCLITLIICVMLCRKHPTSPNS